MRKTITLLRIVFCVVVFLATLEALTRLDDHLQYGAPFWGVYDFSLITMRDQYGIIGRPNGRYTRWKVNNWGFRGPAPRSDTIRIVTLGASETFGIAEDDNREYPRQLEERLNQALGTRSVEVINLGMPGSQLYQTVHRLPQIMDQYHPDFVTLYSNPLVYLYLIRPTQIAAAVVGPPPTLWLRLRGKMVREIHPWVPSRWLALSQNIWRKIRYPDLRQFRIEGRIEELTARSVPAPVLIWWRRREIDALVRDNRLRPVSRIPDETVGMFRSDLVTLVEFFQTRGVPVLLATHAQRFGDRVSPGEEGWLVYWRSFYPELQEDGFLDLERRMNQAVRDVAREHGAVLVDAAPQVPPGPRYFVDFVHFTNEGADRMAALFAEKLTPLIKPHLKSRLKDDRTQAR
jgi:lysophospholipase L1-like esterase